MTIRRLGSSGHTARLSGSHRQSYRDHGFTGDGTKHLTKGPVARDIGLARQYQLRSHGDLARRMGMNAPGDHHKAGHLPGPGGFGHGGGPHGGKHFQRGPISPAYARHHFAHYFRLPSYYVGFYGHHGSRHCWYPHWAPWVRWSWYYTCRPLWDPRPIWCRPWVYVASPGWVWWEFPVWEPLPVVVCGTWVDVAPVAVPPTQFDLQLLAVRFVDPGHPEEKLGPRYRVWFRNNSPVAINQPFDVVLLAGNDDKVAQNLPTAGVRVASIGAGQTQAVDIRLPFEVQQMGRDEQGKLAPFTTLHVLVDANREIDETSEVNNGTRLAADLVLPVDPAAFEVQPKEAQTGGEVLLAGEGLGPEPGRVLVHLGGIELEAEIVGWYDLGVCFKAPALPLAAPVEAELIVIRRDGIAANPLHVTIKPKAIAEQAVPEQVAPPPAMPPAAVPGAATSAPSAEAATPEVAAPKTNAAEQLAPLLGDPNSP